LSIVEVNRNRFILWHEEINSLHIPYELFYDRPRPVSRKISEEGG